jgi:hypothetical protein
MSRSRAPGRDAKGHGKKWQNVSSIDLEEIHMSKATVSGTKPAAPKEHHGIDHSIDLGHGNSPAAWTCVIVMLIGALIAAIAFVIANTPIFWSGIGVMVLGLLAGLIMRKAGYGVGGSKIKNSGH